jgi:OOP family OmpA-OmpF porin
MMGRFVRMAVVFLFAFIMVSHALGQSDTPQSKDYPGITRMPNFYIYQYSDSQFDSVKFPITQSGKKTEQAVEGHTIKIQYIQKENTPATSMLQIVRNLQNAGRAAGGQVMDDSRGDNWYNTTLRLNKNGKEVWVLIEARSDSYWQSVVERQAMQQDVVMDAAGMANGLSSTGSVAIYGIYFDTAKSDLKPESETTLAEIAKLLKQTPALKVFIVGHTDMVGDPAANVKLSQARAQSVVSALVSKYGVAATRLSPFGNGPYAPVASNKTEEGRAKNRRVELVELATR